jgi:hypothetical protein
MIIQKILETYLDLIEPQHIFAADVEEVCMHLLTNKFVNKCYKSCYILRINKLIRTSGRYMIDSLEGYSSICVSFEVDAIIYQEGEIINGCKITKIEPYGRIYAESKYTSIQLKQDKSLSIFKEDNIIPVIVKTVRYYPNKDKISVGAIPFIPLFPVLTIYNVKEPLTQEQIPKIEYILKSIKVELDAIKKLSTTETKAYNFFKLLVYPFKKTQSFESNSKVKNSKFKKRPLELKELLSIKNGMICRPIELAKHNNQFYYSNESPSKLNNIIVIDDSMFNISINILNDYLLHLITLREMYEYYPDVKVISKYTDIWKIFKMLKK